jgi:hypothetical protein
MGPVERVPDRTRRGRFAPGAASAVGRLAGCLTGKVRRLVVNVRALRPGSRPQRAVRVMRAVVGRWTSARAGEIGRLSVADFRGQGPGDESLPSGREPSTASQSTPSPNVGGQWMRAPVLTPRTSPARGGRGASSRLGWRSPMACRERSVSWELRSVGDLGRGPLSDDARFETASRGSSGVEQRGFELVRKVRPVWGDWDLPRSFDFEPAT